MNNWANEVVRRRGSDGERAWILVRGRTTRWMIPVVLVRAQVSKLVEILRKQEVKDARDSFLEFEPITTTKYYYRLLLSI